MKEISNKSSLCFTIRDLSSCIKAYALGYDYRDVIQCFYGARYESEERKNFNNFLKTKYNFLYKENNDYKIPNLFKESNNNFYSSKSLRRLIYFASMSRDVGRHILITSEQGNGLNCLGTYIAKYFDKFGSGDGKNINKIYLNILNNEEYNTKSNDNKIKKEFTFIFTPETTVVDLIGRYKPSEKTNSNKIIEWEDGPLTNAIIEGQSGIFLYLNLAQQKVLERLNSLFEEDNRKKTTFIIHENYQDKEKCKIQIHKNFNFIGTCEINNLTRLSPAFLNRLQIINIDDQLEEANKEEELDILIEKILKQESENFEGFEFLLDNLNMYFNKEDYDKKIRIIKKEIFRITDLANIVKSFFRIFSQYKKIYLSAEKDINELILFIIELLFFQIEQISIPKEIENEFNSKNDGKINEIKLFYFNDKIKKLLICMHCYYICRIPVCLVGSTGLGKTCFAKSFAELFSPGKKYNYYSFHMDTQIEDLYGNFIFSNNYFTSQIGPLFKSIKVGTIFIADEFNLADDYILLSTLTAIEAMEDEKIIYIPNMLTKIKCNLNFFFIACQNDLSTMGRKILPSHILRKLKSLNYPILNESDLKMNCLEILNKENTFNQKNNKKNEILAQNLAKFMIKINKKNLIDLGKWSMRNIRKILKRISLYHEKNENFQYNFKNISDEAGILLYVLGGVQKNKQKIIFEKIYPDFKEIFFQNKEEFKKLDEIFTNIYQKEKSEFKIEINNNYKYLTLNDYFKIKLNSENISLLNNFENHEIIKESLFYALLSTNKESLLICGPSGYKKFLAKIIKSKVNQIDLYKETSIKQLLGQINVINKENAQKYLKNLINKIITFNTNYNEIINDFDNDSYSKNIKIPYIQKIVKNLFKNLRNIKPNNEEDKNNFIHSFTTIFKIGFLIEKILLNQPVLLNNISNLSPQVLERFNDLFNFPSFLRIPEDHCQTIIEKNEEINNLDKNFRILACSGIENFSNLSEAIKSRFTIIHTTSYDLTNKIFVIKTIFKKIFEKYNINNDDRETLNKKIENFIKNFKINFYKELDLSSLIKLTYIFKLIKLINQSNDPYEILSLAFYITFKSYEINNGITILNYIQSFFKENKIKNIEENINFNRFENIFKYTDGKKYLISNITHLNIKCVDKQFEEIKVAETNSFLKILNFIHTSTALKIPLIIKGENGTGKKTAVYYFASKIGYEVISFNFLSSTTVDDLLCKTNILDSNGKLNPCEKKLYLLN